MPAAYTTLELYDGTNTLDLVDSDNYQLVDGGWAPRVPRRRRGIVGNQYIYEDVVEELTINVRGATATAVHANLAALANILEIAEAWNSGALVDPVIFKVQPQGSDLTNPLQAVVVGGDDSNEFLSLPVDYNDKLMVFEVSNVVLRFKRRIFLGDEDSDTSSAATNPAIMTCTMSENLPIPSPTRIEIDGWPNSTMFLSPGYLIITDNDQSSQFRLMGTRSGGSGSWSTVADTANDATGGNVNRLSSISAGTWYFATFAPYITSNLRTTAFHFFANVRVNHTSDISFRAYVTRGDGFLDFGSTRKIIIDRNSGNPQIVYFGQLQAGEGWLAEFKLFLQANDFTGTPTFDIDYVALVPKHETTSIIRIDAQIDNRATPTLVVDPALLEKPKPYVAFNNFTFFPYVFPLRHQGNSMVLTAKDEIRATWLMPKGSNWVWDDSGTPQSLTMTATRRPAYLVPQ
jgi:hypothetical protein